MATGQVNTVLRQLRQLITSRVAELTDRQLLERFLTAHEEEAFAAMVQRHGALVWGTCLRLLANSHDAEDAFQATFLVLVRRARSIRSGESLGSWLHGVACRVALKARAEAARRRARERQVEDMRSEGALADVAWRDLRPVLDEEVGRLPEKYRAPLILCYLEGKSCAEAARQLGGADGTIYVRLSRGRELLRRRLVRRGITLSGASLAAVLAQQAARASVPAALVETVIEGALGLTAGVSGISPSAVALAEGSMRTMMLTSLAKHGAALLLALGLLVAGGWAVLGAGSGRPPQGSGEEELRTNADGPNPEGKKQAAADLHGDPLPPGVLARLGAARFRHGNGLNSVTFSPDGKMMASAGDDHLVRLWDPATGKEIRTFGNLQERPNPYSVSRWVYCVAFSPDSKLIAAGEFAANWPSNIIRVWETATGKELLAIQGHQAGIRSLAFSPDGKQLASASADQSIRLWETATGREIRALPGHQGQATCVAFAADGKTLASAGTDRVVRLWEVATGKELHRLAGQQGGPGSIAFLPDGKVLASAGEDKKVRFYDIGTGQESRCFEGHADEVGPIALSPDGKTLASAGSEPTVLLWDAASGKKVQELKGVRTPVRWLAFASDGKSLAAVGSLQDNRIRFWDVATGQESRTDHGHQSWVGFLAFTADGKSLASASRDGSVRFWEPSTSKELRRFSGQFKVKARAAAFSPDERGLIIAGPDGSFRLVESATGKELRRFAGHAGGVLALAFAPDGKMVASGGVDKAVRIWDTATGQELRRMDHQGWVHTVLFSPDGKRLAALIGDQTVYLWEAATGKELSHLEKNPGVVGGIAFAPDGKTLAACCFDGTAVIYDWATGQALHRFEKHPGYGQCVAFSPDGRLLAVGSWMSIRLWETATGKERGRFLAHEGDVSALAFAADGRVLASGSSDTTILLWDLTGRMRDGRLAAAELSPEGLRELWSDLAGDDGVKATKAIWTMTSAPGQTIPWLKKHLQPVPALDEAKLKRLIADLDNDDFGVREKATIDLEKMGYQAEPALKKVLNESNSAEVRQRAAGLLEKLGSLASSPERLQVLRALEVLEHINDREAHQLLESLAKGASEVWLTEEAKIIRERLARRAAVSP